MERSRFKKILDNFSWRLGGSAFWVIIGLIAVSAAVSALVFYKYAYLAIKQPAQNSQNLIKFDDVLYSKVLESLKARGDEAEMRD